MRASAVSVLPALAVLSAGVLLGGCASTVGGTAEPMANPPTTSQDRAAAGEPCALLTAEEAGQFGLVGEGKFRPGDPPRLVPPSCNWAQSDPNSELDALDAGFSTDFSLAEYVDGAEPSKTAEFGGLTWNYLSDPITGGSVCMLATEVSETSFVVLTTSNFDDESKACAVAEQAAPYIASHLPGGDPAPEPTTSAKPEPSALASVDPCTLLKPKQAKRIGLSDTPSPLDELPEYGTPGGCQWQDTDGEKGAKPLDLYAGDYAAEKWPYADGKGQEVKAGDRTWKLFPAAGGSKALCQATLEFTKTSSVLLRGGNLSDSKKACAEIRAAIPLITGNLPK